MNALKYIFAVFSCLIGLDLSAQVYIMQNGTEMTCAGTFYDSGGPGANYSDNESYTYTFCSNGSDLVMIDFTSFSLNGNDALEVFDGPSNASPSFGVYNAGMPLNGVIAATPANTSGCLTFVFTSDGATTSTGWEGTVSCYVPCQSILSVVSNTVPAADANDEIAVCQGDQVDFTAMGNYIENGTWYTQSDLTSTFLWDFGDGTTGVGTNVSHSFPLEQGYNIALLITDAEGCTSSNVITTKVKVSTTPNFGSSAIAQDTICFGETNQLSGGVNTVEYIESYGNILADTTALPDNVGSPYTTSVTLGTFAPGQTLNNINDLTEICIEMEHSYAGDLNISIECPTGQTVTLVQYPNGCGNNFLGEPVDDDMLPNVEGIGYWYCFSATAPNGTWGATAGVNQYSYIDQVGTSVVNQNYIPSATYTPDNSLAPLVGCDLNGDWTITVVDNLGSDNGFIFGWYVEFDPSIFPNLLWVYEPTIVTENWVASTDITNTTGNTITVAPTINGGNASYDYTMTDDFGCTYDTTLTFYVLPSTDPQCYVCFEPLMSGIDLSCWGSNDGAVIALPNDSMNLSPPPYNFTWYDDFNTTLLVTTGEQGADTLDALEIGSYTVVVTDSNGCQESGSFTIGQPAEIVTIISAWEDVTCFEDCDGSVNLQVTGGVTPYMYKWSDNSNLDSNYALCAGALVVTITDINGCIDSINITVTEPPELLIETLGDDTICVSNDASIYVVATGGNGNYTYNWENGQVMNDSMYIPNPTGTYSYTIIVNDYKLCVVDTAHIVYMQPPLDITIPATDTLCLGEEATVMANAFGGDGNYSFQWNNGLSTSETLIIGPVESSVYSVTLTDGCGSPLDEASIEIFIGMLPIFDYYPNNTDGCAPHGTQFTVQPLNPIFTYEWDFDEGYTMFNSSQTVFYNYVEPGCKDVSLTVTSELGCSETIIDSCGVEVFPVPTAAFEYTPTEITNIQSVVNFINFSEGADNYQWDLGDGETSSLRHLQHEYPVEGDYTIRLAVATDYGCSDTATTTIRVEPQSTFYVPNAFTPDDNAYNATFGPVYSDIITENVTDYEMYIFARNGNRVFSTTDIFNPWNGRVDNHGKLVGTGVYAYLIKYTDIQNLEHIIRGHVTVIW